MDRYELNGDDVVRKEIISPTRLQAKRRSIEQQSLISDSPIEILGFGITMFK